MDDVGSSKWWRRLHDWADVIHADFQTVISRYLQNISTYLFCTAERMLRTIIMQNSRMIQACFPIKIDKVWMDRFCVRYDWWRRLQQTSSVSPVCNDSAPIAQVMCMKKIHTIIQQIIQMFNWLMTCDCHDFKRFGCSSQVHTQSVKPSKPISLKHHSGRTRHNAPFIAWYVLIYRMEG